MPLSLTRRNREITRPLRVHPAPPSHRFTPRATNVGPFITAVYFLS
jgi:hypothetical protein